MTEDNSKTTRYFVTTKGRAYIAKDAKTGDTLFTSDEVPDGATVDEMGVIGAQAENFLNTLYPKWREVGSYW